MTPKQFEDALNSDKDVIVGDSYVFRHIDEKSIVVQDKFGVTLSVSPQAVIGEFRTESKAIIAKIW